MRSRLPFPVLVSRFVLPDPIPCPLQWVIPLIRPLSTHPASRSNLKRDGEITKYYDLQENLGKGSFAVVKRAQRKSDNRSFAIKIIRKDKLTPDELKVVYDEMNILRSVQHPNCVKLFEVYETPRKIQMVMELLTGGELFDRIVAKDHFTEKEAAEVIRDMADALRYLHANNIVHRDLKPENIVYLTQDPNSITKLTDFGLAKAKTKGITMTTACGTPQYVAPEILRNERYTSKVDIWSLGVILYIMLCGFPPFYHTDTAQLYEQIKSASYSFPDPYWRDISPEAKDLVMRMLTLDPQQRISATEVLQHPWLRAAKNNTRALGSEHTQRIKLLQAKRKLRRAVQLIIAANKFASILDKLAHDETYLNVVAERTQKELAHRRTVAVEAGHNPELEAQMAQYRRLMGEDDTPEATEFKTNDK